MLGARRFLNLLCGALVERLDGRGREEIDGVLADEGTEEERRAAGIRQLLTDFGVEPG